MVASITHLAKKHIGNWQIAKWERAQHIRTAIHVYTVSIIFNFYNTL